MSLFPRLTHADSRLALVIEEQAWTYAQLAEAALQHGALLERAGIDAGDRVAVWASPSASTAAEMIGNLARGVTTIPLNPKLGSAEVAHIFGDAEPRLAFSAESFEVPHEVAHVPSLRADYAPSTGALPEIPEDAVAGLILYTSGTTGLPKGAVTTRANIAANLDSLAEAWEWTEHDMVVHSLPLIHAHGLVLGLFGSLRVGGALHYVPKFSPHAIAKALGDPRHEQTLCFAVPTMYHRIA